MARFASFGISQHELEHNFLMRAIPMYLEHFRRFEAREDLRLLQVNGLPYLTDEYSRDAAYNELYKRAYGQEAEVGRGENLPTYLPSTKPDVAAMLGFVTQGDIASK